MSRALRRGLALVAASGLLLGVQQPVQTLASWQEPAYARAVVRSASSDCSTTGVFGASASAAMLAGTAGGTAIGAATGATAAVGRTTAASSTTTVLDVASTGSAPAGLPIALTTGARWRQTAATTGTGASSASAGVDAAGGTAAAFGRVDVGAALGPAAATALPGLSGVGVDVGRVSASASLDGCAIAWGGAPAAARRLDAAVSALGLGWTDAAATTFLGTARDRSAALLQSLTARGAAGGTAPVLIAARSRGAAQTLLGDAGGVLGLTGAVVGAPTSTVAVTTTGAPVTAVAAAGSLAEPSGVVTTDVATGRSTADLGLLVGGLQAAAADTAVLAPGRTTTLTTAVGAALAAQQTRVQQAWETAAASGTTITVTAGASITGTLLGVPTGTSTITVALSGTADQWAAGTPVVGAPVQTGAVIAGLLDAVRARLADDLVRPVVAGVADGWVTPSSADVTAAERDLATALGTARTGTASHLASLASALALTLGVRPDLDATQPAWTGGTPSGAATVSALRVRVVGGGATKADLLLGNAAVGPDTAG